MRKGNAFCKTCEYWERAVVTLTKEGEADRQEKLLVGHCMFYPPVHFEHNSIKSSFPHTYEDCLCGQYAAKTE